MKKAGILATALAVFIGFFIAVGVCVDTLKTSEVFAGDSGLKIVIDAGHGGIDGGVSGINTGIRESDLNLKISLLIAERLQKSGFKVALTRKTKEGLYDTTAKGFKWRDMLKRKEIIERETPSLLLSVHQNAYPSSAERGAQVFYRKGDEEDRDLSACLQTRLNALYAREGVKGRKYMSAEYFILGCSPCPSALVECGFLSSPKDESLLTSDAFLKELVQEICEGLTDYLFSKA